ncbi:N-terminal domain of NEFA-interacting nuclear protein NIP30-domain-containing protein [Dioszegia hungarica]|uniref:N-terminal domain of NEFA-interacting nuclear protein NIP30-domain-containing protein n=1 Tax=Dioszegia hungarica TaxID=4972 RepID=A0AA38LWR8_9TREE|nr:N-terminal domain of NEFA-interacting nuclear protein NIP30-domain-containing protein [Dioszegia hungarica]KAI9636631.1 N-terminal domain of NEFA-interacting nuclear protein NIP30-domain-containing protein [Dioszegia hungarica]
MTEQAPDFLAKAQEGMGSRFQSQASIDESNTRREKEWKEAYARLGQEPPKATEFAHDGLTLFERLETNKRLNTEEWDDKMKLANQYRGINADEKRFLDERYAEKMAAQKVIDDEVAKELEAYRQAKKGGDEPEPTLAAPVAAAARKPLPTKPKKDVKSLLKGVVVKKKPKAKPDPSAAGAPGTGGKIGPTAAEEEPETEGESEKRAKVDGGQR